MANIKNKLLFSMGALSIVPIVGSVASCSAVKKAFLPWEKEFLIFNGEAIADNYDFSLWIKEYDIDYRELDEYMEVTIISGEIRFDYKTYKDGQKYKVKLNTQDKYQMNYGRAYKDTKVKIRLNFII